MSHRNRLSSRTLALAGFFALPLSLATLTGSGEVQAQVVLNPVDIAGTISIGSEELSGAFVEATSEIFSATQNFNADPTDPTVVNYALTVDVPIGGSRDYQVQACFANLVSTIPGTSKRYCFEPVTVTVIDPNDSVQNFIIDQPGFIQGIVTVNSPVSTLVSASLIGFYDGRTSGTCNFFRNIKCFSASTSATANGAFDVAVLPAGDINIVGFAQVDIDGDLSTFSDRVSLAFGPIPVDLLVGETEVVNIEITPPSGVIMGAVTMPGSETVTRTFVSLSGPANQSSNRPGSDGLYELIGLPDGTYNMFVQSSFDGGRSFTHPASSFSPTNRPEVLGGASVTVNVTTPQAFIDTQINLTGSGSLDDLARAEVFHQGLSGTPSSGAQARDTSLDFPAGAFNSIASAGDWRISELRLSPLRDETDLSDSFSEFLQLFPDFTRGPRITIGEGETGLFDLDIPLGKVTVNFEITTTDLLSDPFLEFSCVQENEAGERVLTVQASNSRATFGEQVDVPVGVVGFLAPGGTCTVTARATVNGTTTTFGTFPVEVIPNVDQEIDLGGPTLIVDFPEPDLVVGEASIVATGMATDDVEVASVTVNGAAASLVDAGDPDDLAKVNFTGPATPLLPGINQLNFVATDTSAKMAQQTRSVCFDLAPPSVAWTPLDGTSSADTSIAVEGVADDDNGVTSVLVNGVSLPLAPTGSGNEVAFATAVDLVDGDNFITLVVRDVCREPVSQTRVVTLGSGNTPPVAEDVEVTTDEDGAVATTLDVTDPEDDALTYMIVTPPANGTLSGTAPDLTYTPNPNFNGPDLFVYSANDGEFDSNEATVSITVDPVNDPPVADAGDDLVLACSRAEGALVDLDGSGSSDLDGDMLIHTWIGPFPEGSGTVVGETVTVTLPLGSSAVLLTVDDGTEQVAASLNVGVTAQVAGLLPPLAGLVPEGAAPPMPNHAFKQGRTLPLRFSLKCGASLLGDADVAPPRIAGIASVGGTPINLDEIDPDAGEANDGGTLFRYSADDGIWVHNLNTKGLARGTVYIITLEMPDGLRYDAKLAFK